MAGPVLPCRRGEVAGILASHRKGCYGCVACQHAGSSGAYGRFEVTDIGLRRPDALVAAGVPSIADFKVAWARLVHGARRLGRLRRIWAALGTHLREIKDQGKGVI